MHSTKIYVLVSLELQSDTPISEETSDEVVQEMYYTFTSATNSVAIISTEIEEKYNEHPANDNLS